jgi:GAF domain-containing protein
MQELYELTGDFRSFFQPATELLIVPFEARGQLRGLVVADNKFTGSPITPESVNTLITFINTFSIIVDNHQLLDETTFARERLQACFEASNAIALSSSPDQVLRDIVEQSPRVAAASWVRLLLIDALGNVKDEMVAGLQKAASYHAPRLRSHGLSMQAMNSRKPVKIEDARTEPDASPFITENQIAAALCMPLLLQGSPIGVMWINYDRPRRFQKFEIEALQLYVNQAAMAYENARRMADLESLNRTAQEISKSSSLKEALVTIASLSREVCQAETAVLWPYDPARRTFVTGDEVIAHEAPVVFHTLQGILRIGESLGVTVAKEGWLGVPDVVKAQSGIMPDLQRLLRQAGVVSFQALALRVNEDLEGLLFLDYREVRGFDARDRRLLEEFGRHAALSLKNVRLFERVRRAKAAAEFVARMVALEHRHDTLPAIVTSIRDALTCDAVVLFAYNPRAERWSYPPASVGFDDPAQTWPKDGETAVEGSIVSQLLREDGPIVISEDPRYQHRPFARKHGIVSCVATPLTAAGQKVGVMFVNYRTQHHFSSNLTDIELFANQAAVAIRISQLFDALQKDQLQALQDFQHQIKNPIAQAHSRILRLLESPPLSREDQRKEILTISSLCARAKRVSTNINLYAELARGEVIATKLIPFTTEKIANLLHEGATDNLTVYRNRQITFMVDDESFASPADTSLFLDPDLLEHAINNVLDNAFKYSYKSTRVRIRGGRRRNEFYISVVNRGTRISPEEVEKTKEREWQGEEAKHTASEGKGIGLWIVDHIMKALGGRVEIRATTEAGDTEILLFLPLQIGDSEGQPRS